MYSNIDSAEQLIHSPFSGHIFENMVIIEKIKQFTEKGERSPCYFYRSAGGLEIDLVVDCGHSLEAYEIKFSSSPKPGMARSLAEFGKEFNVTKLAVLNLRRNSLPFSNNIMAEHWYRQ